MKQVLQWKQVFDKKCKQSFPKICIKSKKIRSSKADMLINKRNHLVKNDPTGESTEIKKL